MANRRGSYAADARGPGALPGAAADAGRLSPLPVGRWLLAVTRVPGTAPADQCGDPSNGADDYFAVKARRLGRSHGKPTAWDDGATLTDEEQAELLDEVVDEAARQGWKIEIEWT